MENFVIVGGGLAGHQAVKSILETHSDAHVSLISDERHLPYDRPPLSKGFLATQSLEPALLAGENIYLQPRIKLISGSSVDEVEQGAARVRLSSGTLVDYDKLIIATGSRVKTLSPEMARAPVNYLRTFDDALLLRNKLVDGADVVIIGGGFIGLEVAAAACQRECRVTVIEPQPQLLARAGSRELSQWIQALHVSKGVNVQVGVSISGIDQLSSGKIAVETSAGRLTADIVIAGIGVQPNVELALSCGLKVDDGIVVDSHCATSTPNIFAAGEVTNYPVTQLGIRTRSESWTAASDQGAVAGRAAAGDITASYAEVPWLWSDQFSGSVQCIGLTRLAVKYSVIGDITGDQWLAIGWNADDQLVYAIAANQGRDISAIRRALKRGAEMPKICTDMLVTAISCI